MCNLRWYIKGRVFPKNVQKSTTISQRYSQSHYDLRNNLKVKTIQAPSQPTRKQPPNMPLWNIYHPPTTFKEESAKQSLARDITTIYTSIGLPAFYVVVNFIPMPLGSMYIGGAPNDSASTVSKKPFVRFSIDHIAVRLPDDDAEYRRVVDKINGILKPHVEDKGYGWEFHVNETERRLWSIDGFEPPGFGSEGERVWREKGEAVALEKEEGK